MAALCRLCLRYQKINEDASLGEIHKKIIKLFSFWINTSDECRAVCLECTTKVNDFHAFYLQVKKAEKDYIKKSIAKNLHSFDIKEEIHSIDNDYKPQNILMPKSEISHDSNLSSTGESENSSKNTIKSEPGNEDAVVLKMETESHSDNDNNESAIVISSNDEDDDEDDMDDDSDEEDEENDGDSDDSDDDNSESDDINESNDQFVNINFNYKSEFHAEIIKNGELNIKGPQLESLLKEFYEYSCNLCKIDQSKFSKLSMLFDHYKLEHNVRGYVSCCNTHLIKRSAIILHMARHVQPEAFECLICKKFFPRLDFLKLHLQYHAGEKPFMGPTEEESKYNCSPCNKMFRSSATYYYHRKTFHSGIKFLCQECGEEFTAKRLLKGHLLTHESAITCPQCKLVCKNKYSLKKHLEQHQKKPVACPRCDFSCYTSKQLISHINKTHFDVKPHICKICGKQFRVKSYLRKHLYRSSCSKK